MAVSWPLVGRETELAAIQSALNSPTGAGIVLVGEAGVGKTRLAREAIDALARQGSETEWIVATAGARSITFGAFADLVTSQLPAADAPFHQLVSLLAQRAGESGLVIGVDDAHNLDDASASVIQLVAARVDVRVLVTARAGEAMPEAVVGLWKDGLATRLEVTPLDEPTTTRLLETALGGNIETSTARRIWNLTRGNVLFLRELVNEAVEWGELVAIEGEWSLVAPLRAGRRVHEIVSAHLGRLDDAALEALELVALGEPIALAVASQLMTPEVLEGLEGLGLVELDQTAARSVRTAHPIYGEVLRSAIPPLRTRGLLLQLVETLEAGRTIEGADVLRVASWRLEANKPGDPARLLAGAREARSRYDFAMEERLARVALEAGLPEAAPVLVHALTSQGRVEEASEVIEPLRPEEAEDVAQVAIQDAFNLFWGLERFEDAFRALEAAEVRLASTPRWAVACRSERAFLLAFAGRLTEALDVAESVTAGADGCGPEGLRAMVIGPLVAAALGHPERMPVAGPELLALADAHQGEVFFVDVHIRLSRAAALTWAGRYTEGEQASREASMSYPDAPPPLAALLSGTEGLALLARGHARRALPMLETAVVLRREVDPFNMRPLFACLAARARALLGDPAGARMALAEAEAARRSSARAAIFDGEQELSRVIVAMVEGSSDEALGDAIEFAAREGDRFALQALEALHLGVRADRPDVVAPRLAETSQRMGGALPPLCAEHCDALMSRDPQRLAEVGSGFEALGADLLAAEALAQAASLWRELGSRSSAFAAEEHAAALIDQCGVPRPPWLPPLGDSASFLTKREREVARLAAEGQSNRAIATSLSVSVATVESHLHRVYTKLGIDGRDGISSVLSSAR